MVVTQVVACSHEDPAETVSQLAEQTEVTFNSLLEPIMARVISEVHIRVV